MNKVVCNICGTTYPENAAQCPICGYARTAEQTKGSSDTDSTSYTYVKGGRFSKSNVRKRNQSAQRAMQDSAVSTDIEDGLPQKKSNAGLIVLIVILLIAIIAVAGYIVLRFFVPNDFLYTGFGDITVPASTVATQPVQESTGEEEMESTLTDDTSFIACTDILLSESEIVFDVVGATVTLEITLEPVDTTEQLRFESSDGTVATVDANGVVTAIGEGTALISVYCGDIYAECSVTFLPAETEAAPQIEFMLNRKEITFDAQDQSWMLYDGELNVADIIWSSDDNAVATIIDGKVVAVGNGDTTVHGTYNGQTVSCLIHCAFDNASTEATGGAVSEAGGESKRTYKLYNPYGNADDVTIKVDEEFTLKLVDEEKNEVTDAEWKIDDPEICSYNNGIVKGLKPGTANVTATYDGITYTCIVRVG